MFIDLQGCFAAPAARYFPNDGKVPKGSPGDAAGANFVRHDGLPPVPHYGGRIPVRSCNSSGAQNLSGWSEFPPGHWALGKQKFQVPRLHSCAWVCRADGTGSVDGGRPKGLPYPNPEKFLRTVRAAPCGRPRAGLGPAPTRGRNSFCIRRRGGYQPPASLLPPREKVPSVCEADEGGLRNGRSSSAGRPVSGPYEKKGGLLCSP